MRIGILGGTFDPVHLGHTALAKSVCESAALDKVVMIPAGLSPFKLGRDTASGRERVDMLRLAAADEPVLEVSDIEVRTEGVSYTITTLRKLKEQLLKEDELFFILGADAVMALEKWHEGTSLLKEFRFIVSMRPGADIKALSEHIDFLKKEYGADISFAEIPQVDVSSTEVRRRAAAGESLKGLVSEGVARYIKRKGLYGHPAGCSNDGPANDEEYDPAFENLKSEMNDHIILRLKPARYDHTMRVVSESVKMARRYGEDVKKAEIAALFHDACKYMPRDDMNEDIRRYGLDEKYLGNGNLAHGKLAALKAKELFGVEDEDILNAISYHTTGRAGMSMLEKIVFSADTTEPGRTYPGAERLNRLCYEDIDKACFEITEWMVEDLEKKGQITDKDTKEAFEWFRKLVKERS